MSDKYHVLAIKKQHSEHCDKRGTHSGHGRTAFLDVTQCSLVDSYKCFSDHPSKLKVAASGSSETLIYIRLHGITAALRIALYTSIREKLGSNLGCAQVILNEVQRGFPQSIEVNSDIR
jgi:hypothetical protein